MTSTPTDLTSIPELIHKRKPLKFSVWTVLYAIRGILFILLMAIGSLIFFTGVFVIWLLTKIRLLSEGQSVLLMSRFGAVVMAVIFVYILEKFAGVELEFSGDDVPVGENAVILSNHVSNADVLSIVALQYRKGMAGHGKYMAKSVLKYLPLLGWGMNLMGHVFLQRNWEKDKSKVESAFQFLLTTQIPFQLTILAEGTRISEKKRLASLQFASERGIDPPLYQTLIPRFKGFSSVVKQLKNSQITHVYDVTLGYVDGAFGFSDLMLSSLSGKKILLNVKRIRLSDLPIDDDNRLQKWLMERFYRKEQLISNMRRNRCFEGEPIVNLPLKFRLI